MRDIHFRMQAIRRPAGELGGRGITFSKFARSPQAEGGLGVEPEKVLYDLGVSLERMTVDMVMALDESTHWLVPEVFMEAITTGFKAVPWYSTCLVGEESFISRTITAPYFSMAAGLSSADLLERGEGETVKEAEVTYGEREVKIREWARKITLTYNAIRLHRLSFVAVLLKQFGIKFGQLMNAATVERLVNGDQADGSMAPATIGVTSVQDGFTYDDLLRVFIRLGQLGYIADRIIANADGARKLLNMAEFKNRTQGAPLIQAALVAPLPQDVRIIPHAGVGAGKFLIGASSSMALQGTVFPLEVESDKIIAKRIEETVASITTDVINLMRDARVIVDEALLIGADGAVNGFPDWMAAE
jgi:HK97 family phage major capsid protein